MSEIALPKWKQLLFGVLADKNASHRITYIAIFVALNVVVNAVGSIPLGFIQISLTMFVSVLTGIILGPLFGFSACFIGDTLGFFINGGGSWTPWVGIAMGTAAMLGGLVINILPLKFKGALFVKLVFVCILTFLICTWAINTTAGYFLWNSKGLPYWKFVIARLSGQIWVSLFNYALLFIAVPVLNRIKPLKLSIR